MLVVFQGEKCNKNKLENPYALLQLVCFKGSCKAVLIFCEFYFVFEL